jgi:hypothetical protein
MTPVNITSLLPVEVLALVLDRAIDSVQACSYAIASTRLPCIDDAFGQVRSGEIAISPFHLETPLRDGSTIYVTSAWPFGDGIESQQLPLDRRLRRDGGRSPAEPTYPEPLFHKCQWGMSECPVLAWGFLAGWADIDISSAGGFEKSYANPSDHDHVRSLPNTLN